MNVSVPVPVPVPVRASLSAGLLLVSLHLPSAGLAESDFAGYERSLELVRKELTRRPGVPALEEALARVHFRAGRFQEAAAEFQRAIERHPRAGEFYMGLAAAFFQQEDAAKAIETYRRIRELGLPGFSAQIGVPLAQAYFSAGRYADAIVELRAALEAGTRSAEVRYLLGRALEARAREARTGSDEEAAARLDREAVDELRSAISLDAGHAKAHYLLGRLLLRRGERELGKQALETFRRLDRGPKPATEEKWARADGRFEAATAVELARILFGVRDVEASFAYLDHALRVHADFEEALKLRGVFYTRIGRRDDATRAYRELLEKYPENAEGLWNLGLIHYRAGEFRSAADLMLRAAKIRDVAEGWEFLCRLAIEHQVYPERAEEFAREALRRRESPENYSNLAVTLFGAGKPDEAERVLRQGLRKFPGDRSLEVGLRRLLEAKGGDG